MTTLALLCGARAPAGVLPAVHDLARRRPVAQAVELAARGRLKFAPP